MKNIFLRLSCIVLLLTVLMSLAATTAFAESEQTNVLSGINVGFYGDSICAANSDGNIGWAGRIGDKNGMIWDNNGRGGWAVSDCRGDNKTIYYQLCATSVCQKYDMIILHGGTNDAWDSAPLGEMSEDFLSSKEYSAETFAGGLEKVFAFIREKNPSATVGYIINFKFINTLAALNDMQKYVDMTKQICDKWEVPYLDLYSNHILTARMHPRDNSGNYQTTYLYDFIHPTAEGYELLTPYIEKFMISIANSSPISEKETNDPHPEETAAPITDNAATPDTEQASSTSGCKASLSYAVAVSIGTALCGGALLLRRKTKK